MQSKSIRRAEVTSRKEIFDNLVKFTEFKYTYTCIGKEPCNENSFELFFIDYDFEIKCKINHEESVNVGGDWKRGCKWTSIEFQGSTDEIIFGNYEIFSKNTSVSKSKFYQNSLPAHVERLKVPDFCKTVGNEMTIKLQIFRHDQRFSYLSETYENFFESNDRSSDFTFLIGNQRISINKSILASRSEVFATMFESEMMEKRTGVTEIKDVDHKIFNLLMRFIYSGKLDCVDFVDLLKLILAADRYAVKSLVNLCGYRLACILSVDNVADVLSFSEHFKIDFLKEECVDFIIKNQDRILDSENSSECFVNILAKLDL